MFCAKIARQQEIMYPLDITMTNVVIDKVLHLIVEDAEGLKDGVVWNMWYDYNNG